MTNYNMKTENVITFLSFTNGLEFTIGDLDKKDDGVLVDIMKFTNGFQLTFMTSFGEGYGYYLDFDGNEMDEDDII